MRWELIMIYNFVFLILWYRSVGASTAIFVNARRYLSQLYGVIQFKGTVMVQLRETNNNDDNVCM